MTAYHNLLRGALGGGGDDDDVISNSETSGDLTDTNIEKELLQVLEGRTTSKDNVADGVNVQSSDQSLPLEEPEGRDYQEGRGMGDEELEGESSEEDTPPKHAPPPSSAVSQKQSVVVAVKTTMSISMKRRLGEHGGIMNLIQIKP